MYNILHDMEARDREWWLKYNKRFVQYIDREYGARKTAFSKLKDFSNVKVNQVTDAFIKKQIEEYQSFTYRRYNLFGIGSPHDKDFKKLQKALEISKTLESGDPHGLYDVVRYNAINQIVWAFQRLGSSWVLQTQELLHLF